MSGRIYVIPGFAGSELDDGAFVRWVNYTDVLLGREIGLKLAADGVLPDESVDGWTVAPCDGSKWYQLKWGLIPGFYSELITCILSNLPDWPVTVFTYDWRQWAYNTGAKLAFKILNEVPKGQTCTLVGHSMGGLVARYAWLWLTNFGQNDRIRRIVTLGTPHLGSHHTYEELTFYTDALSRWMRRANYIASIPKFLPAKFLYAQRLDEEDITGLFLSWPGFYDLLPSLLAEDAPEDRFLQQCYVPGNWPEKMGWSQKHLDKVTGTYQPMLQSATSLPKKSVLITVAGQGADTGYRAPLPSTNRNFTFSFEDGPLFSIPQTKAGDGTVTTRSALLKGYQQYLWVSNHRGLPKTVTWQNAIIDYITMELDDSDKPEWGADGLLPGSAEMGPSWSSLGAASVETQVMGMCAQGICGC